MDDGDDDIGDRLRESMILPNGFLLHEGVEEDDEDDFFVKAPLLGLWDCCNRDK